MRKGLDCVYRPAGNLSTETTDPLSALTETTRSASLARDDNQYGVFSLPPALDVPELQTLWDMSLSPFMATATSPPSSSTKFLPDVTGLRWTVPESDTSLVTLGAATESDSVTPLSLRDLTKEPQLPWEGFLVCLPMGDPVAQQNATLIIQMLRPYPSMMTRKDTLPPFIHPCLGSNNLGLPFPEPLANCVSIARMFAWRTPETRDFVWKTIWAEQRRLADKATTYSSEELLASLQAFTMYVIMRVMDYSTTHAQQDKETLLYCHVRPLESNDLVTDQIAN
ncbi:hypothetical protein A1O1_05153 [Capronia coronata CBS 617.96]|uniref:Uncharacterized protein n=1 Tax=Capronia coronata CBS 617.96 TaxID=1182541 RepID=W9Y6R0_9EURO|nr:uncharacterized protein A1O1_05153 [Capronia coronata CBS 617.96]EXJ88223.1 hypothetical protein A1O1_05153 [Capronia coronata CBS 617.96]